MNPTIAVIAPGAMGSGVARRLTEHGAVVPTLLDGRSAATIARARAAGMTAADEATITAADIILSILPPGEAVALAERLAPALCAASRKPVYVDCNAVNVETVQAIAAIIAPTGSAFVDGGIIGGPPVPGDAGPVLYLAGPETSRLGMLGELGLRIRMLDGPVGAASALKMCYAGINKGLTGLAAAMILAADRAGAGPALHAELADSQPQLLAKFERSVPDMYAKAYRWVAEMREIADFLGPDDPARLIYEGMAGLYERLAADVAGEKRDIAALDRFLATGKADAAA
ncbi:NAD(P)-dependent oxidoreductase [Inquilinus limosus]|uniref:NAD(P)-dependent oxidoreductase n=1 Tax=Inquilinus limosus TaxID=171674 RepID=UPI00040538F5|nr:NAD(P)-dependent oxidoreductase [Inquilinus limosus]